MANKFTKKRKVTTSNADPATVAKQKENARLRERARRALRKRRRVKSGQ